ncbi:MAG: hypothetical protein WDN27_00600 [Candidatus Saccharibacteria bacterium]
MHKDFIFFIKYPYTAGTIGTIWLGSAILILLSRDVSAFRIVLINVIATVLIAAIGFGGRGDA